jgi:DUF1680 family protein
MRRVFSLGCLLAAAALAAPGPRLADAPKPAVSDKIKDRFVPASLDRQKIEGLLGQRMRVNLDGRLLHVSETVLLAGYPTKAGTQGASGENAGKFLDAASRTWAYSGDPRLRGTMDRVASVLAASEIQAGWRIGDLRWTLTGLLGYYQVTADAKALAGARRIGDMLARTFGDGPGQQDIIVAGAHMGLAATSVLEPMCVLYHYTGGPQYLDFARYIVRAYDQPRGPKLIQSLEATGSVYRIADARADDILDNLSGLLELYRLTGDEPYLKAATTAWKDIVSKRLYITGAVSSGEYFRDDLDLPGEEAASVGEGCATVAWLDFNRQLLLLTGEARYAGEIERTAYNQLLGSQDPHNGSISRFTPLVGRKRPGANLNCAVSSEPRAIAMIPGMAWGEQEGGVAVLLYAPGEATIALRPDFEVTLASATRFPQDGKVVITLRLPRPARFPVFLRVPEWATHFTAAAKEGGTPGQPGSLLKLERMWHTGDTIQIQMDLPVRAIPGGGSYPDFVALARGPQILALEAAVNPQVPYIHRTSLKEVDASRIELRDATAGLPKTWTGSQAYSVDGAFAGKPEPLILVPFADALNYRVWLLKPGRVPIGQVAVTAFGTESWSRTGSAAGSICDERPDTYRTSFEGKAAKEDWYAVEMDRAADITRIVYRHGKTFENGGWFDTSAGKPRIQIKKTKNGPWESAGALDSYPDFTSAQVPVIRDGEPFTLRLPQPVHAVAIRVVGKPGRSFSSCAELSAYGQ